MMSHTKLLDTSLMLPADYIVNGEGIICRLKNNGITQPLFMTRIRGPVCCVGRYPQRELCFTAEVSKDSWEQIALQERFSLPGWMRQIRSWGIQPYVPAKTHTANFLTWWIEKVDAAQKRELAPAFTRPVR